MQVSVWVWVFFAVLVLSSLALDLGFYRTSRGEAPFLVYTSNIFAMLGLRALYFLLAGIIERFRYLRVGLAAILIFFGARLLLSDVVEVPHWFSLSVIATALTLSVIVSIKRPTPAAPAHT